MRISDWSSDVCSSDLIIGDANLCEVSTYLKIGTTALVLSMIEAGYLTRPLTVEGSVAALRAVSHDPTCKELITLHDGRKLTGRSAERSVGKECVRTVRFRWPPCP